MGQSRKATPSRGPAVKARTPSATNGTGVPSSSVVVNDVTAHTTHASPAKSPSKSPKPKKSLKQQRRTSRPKRTTLLDHIVRAALFSLALYALLVCPSDTSLESPTCRAIASWRQTIEPRISAPLHCLLAHPRIAPVVDAVKPHIDTAITRATPVVVSIQRATGPRIRALRVKTRKLSAPYIRKWQLEYEARVHPYVQRYVHPVLETVEPHLREAQRRLLRAWVALEPHVRHAQSVALKFYENTLVPFYEHTLKPRVLEPAWNYAQNAGEQVRDQLIVLKHAYVDEQFGKMVAKIEELGGRSKVHYEQTTITSTTASSSSVADEVIASTAAAPPASPQSTVSSSSTPAATPEVIETIQEPTAQEPIQAVLPSNPDSEGASGTVDAPAPEAQPEPEEDPLDFLAAFTGSDSSDAPVESASTPSSDPQEVVYDTPPHYDQGPSPEEVARRALETVQKRKEIESRLETWEGKIDSSGKELRAQLVQDVQAIRASAVASLAEDNEDPESLGAKIAAFKKDGAKALKGTKAYAQKLMSGHYHGAEKIGLFDSVVKKVDARYASSAAELSTQVASWWASIREEVEGVVRKRAEEVLDVAQRAQGDLGLDLSYLDDVTVGDWERYHRLLERAQAYETRYLALVSGTSPGKSPLPADPLPSALAALQADLQDHLANFAADLLLVRDEGFALIKGTPPKEPKSPAKGEFSILPVAEARDEFIGRGKEEILDALSRAGEAVTGTATPTAKREPPVLNRVNDVVDAIFADAGELFEDAKTKVSEVKEKVHQATRAASRAAGATPSPESFGESVESVVHAATEALPSVPSGEEVKAAVEDAGASVSSVASSVYDDASSIVHHATRSAASAAGATPSPETFDESTDSLKAKVHSLTREAARKAGLSVTPEGVHEHVSSVVSVVSETASSVVSVVSESASSVVSEASATVSSVYVDAESVIGTVTAKIADTASTASASASSVYADASSAVHSSVRKAAKAAGVHVEPEGAHEYLESIAEDVIAKVHATAISPAASAVYSATRSLAKAAGVSVTPEGVQEHVESATSRLASAYESVSASYRSGARAASKAAGVQPQATNVKERMEDLADDAKASVEAVVAGASSVVADASSVVHQATRSVLSAAGVTPSPENLAESVTSVKSRVSESLESIADKASSVVSEAYGSASTVVVGHEEL